MKSLLAVLTTWSKLSVVEFNFDLNLIYKFYSKKAAQVGSNSNQQKNQLKANKKSESTVSLMI